MEKSAKYLLPLAVTFAMLLIVNLGASVVFRSAKIDLTEEKLYTLSDGSKSMLGKLDNDVRLKLFYSRRASSALPIIKQYSDRVIGLLNQYQDASGGKIEFEILDPRPDTETEELAAKYGVQPFARTGAESLYFGLVIVSEIGDEHAIPFLDPGRESFLEYDLSRLISSVASPDKPTLGIMSPLAVMGGAPNDPMAMAQGRPPAEAWMFVRQLQDSYELEDVPMSSTSIRDDIDLLLVVHPKSITSATEYAIDQYLLRGGRAIVLVDPLSEAEKIAFQNPDPSARFQAQFDSNLPKLFANWGISLDISKVVADMNLATRVQMGPQPVQHPAWMTLSADNCNQEEIVSSDLENVLLASAGELEKNDSAPYEIVTLLETTDAASTVDSFRLKFGTDPEALRAELSPGGVKLPLAFRISGKFNTAFPGGDPSAAGAEEDEDPDHLETATEETSVIVVADVDFIADDFSVRKQNFFGSIIATPLNNNLDFLGNAVDILTGSQDLIGLRTRGKSSRPFTRVDEIERDAQQKYRAEEQALNERVEEINRQLTELQRGKAEGQVSILSAEQRDAIDGFNDELAETKKNLREVRLKLRQDIERLGRRIKFINIALMPLLAILASIIPYLWRSARMRSTHG